MQPEHHTRGVLPTNATGRLKVSNWVIATVPTAQAAEACAQALEDAGFADDDVLVESSATALHQLQADEDGRRHAGVLARLVAAFEDSISEAASVRDHYVAEAQAGRVFIGAHDAQGNQVDVIRNLFLEHGASSIYLFDPAEIRCLGE